MSPEHFKDWLDYYRQKGLSNQDLITMSGYDHPLAQLTQKGLEDLTSQISNFLQIQPEDRLLDVGCGAGIITSRLNSRVISITGVDANHEMIKHAPNSIRKVVGSADNLPFTDCSFNKILCHSIFQYFPDLDYSETVLKEFKRVAKTPGGILIMDVPDIDKREDYLKTKGFDSSNLSRIFYSKSWFSNILPHAQIFDHSVVDYENSKYRFNVLIRQ